MKAYYLIPGVPAGGHVTAGGGYWHPGRIEGCVKCEPHQPAPRVPSMNARRDALRKAKRGTKQ